MNRSQRGATGSGFATLCVLAGLWLVTLPALLFGAQGVLVPLRLSALGFGAVAIGAVYLVATALEATAAPLIGRLSDRRGRRLPIVIGLSASATATALLPWPDSAALLAVVAVFSAVSFGTSWAPAMSFAWKRRATATKRSVNRWLAARMPPSAPLAIMVKNSASSPVSTEKSAGPSAGRE